MFAKLMTGLVPPARVFALVADVLFPSSYLDVEDVDNPGQTKRKSVEQVRAFVCAGASEARELMRRNVGYGEEVCSHKGTDGWRQVRADVGRHVRCLLCAFVLMSVTDPQICPRRHRVSAEKLAIISKTIPRIAIITGDDDNLINPQRSHDLHRMLPVRTSRQACSRPS